MTATSVGAEPIAIIGLALRVPGANDPDAFWRNLVDGVESVTRLGRDELLARGVSTVMLDDPSFVPASAVLDGVEYFDAGLFGMSAREADIADPQLRIFLEQAHAALVDAGHDPARYPGDIGVYAGSGAADYQWLNVRANPRAFAGAGELGLSVGNHPDYVATTVSYRLNLRGPSLTLHTACSSSLVALHLACEALRGGECDMALAGGVCVDLPYGVGYLGSDGFLSPDGHCRPFDAGANGTLWGSGVGVVLLKRLTDALADGDTIRAVLLGNAINNDGAGKVGFSAPSVDGQIEVIKQALDVAAVDPRTVGYVEAHGTGTALGDPIEVAALSAVYGEGTDDRGWCGIGSVKSNIGHLSQAAGVVGVIKTVLALEHGIIPPTVNYTEPNPRIDFEASPFYVAAALSKWDSDGNPRRAAVSSFGIGGTNAHVILEEAPPVPRRTAAPTTQLVQLSARTPTALAASTARLAERLAETGDALDDAVYTLRVGRTAYRHRAAVVARDGADAAAALADPKRLATGEATGPLPRVALLFSGQGSQYAGMGAELYRCEPIYAAAVDECARILLGPLGCDIRPLLFPDEGQREAAEQRLRQTALTQPALFTVEYALAALWSAWGVDPAAMIGHSIGEYVAATRAGVFPLADALGLVVTRGRLMQSMPPGAMLAVQLGEEAVASRLPAGLSVATVNSPATCVVAGPEEAVAGFAGALRADGIGCTALRTSHAFHSAMMEPILDDFTAAVAGVTRRPPSVPFLSNVTGDWITGEQATDPAYWARQLRAPVRFGDCVATLLRDPAGGFTLVECGPGRQLAGLARMQLPRGAAPPLHSLPGPNDRGEDLATILSTAARLWVTGAPVDIGAGRPAARRTSLPGYPYERRYHWISPDASGSTAATSRRRRRVDDWFEVPVWRQLPPDEPGDTFDRCLCFAADDRAEALVSALGRGGTDVIAVRPGADFARGEDGFTVHPGRREDYDALVGQLVGEAALPERIVFAWPLAGADLDLGFFGLLCLAQALAAARCEPGLRLDVVTAGTVEVLGGDLTEPLHAMVAGVARVAPLEITGLVAAQTDLDPAGVAPDEVITQLRRPITAPLTALRRGRRWIIEYETAAARPAETVLREHGRYLITGGLGGIGITLAEELAGRCRARLVLLSRTDLPPRADWDAQVAIHGDSERVGRAIAAIRRMEAAGASVTTLAADVTDPAALAEVRHRIDAELGGLDGIVHSAGVPGGGMIEVKQRDVAESVLAPKLGGTLALAKAFGDVPLDFVALCSSVTGIAGDFGQVDYCAANAFLDAYASSAHGWRGRVVSVNWGGWSGVGMAAEVAAPAAFRALQRGVDPSTLDHPILTALVAGEPTVARGRLSTATHWVLDEHRIATVGVLPGTAYLETVRAAVTAAGPAPGSASVVELRDVMFVEPLAVPDGTTVGLTVALTPSPGGTGGGFDFEVRSLAGGIERRHARGWAGWVDGGPARPVDLAAIRERCRPVEVAAAETARVGVVELGPRWNCLGEAYTGAGEELAYVEANETVRAELDRWTLHPALLDVATAFGRDRGSGSYLPLGYGRVVVRAALPAAFYSHLRYRDAGSDEIIAADLSLIDEAGRELVAVSEFLLRRVDPGAVASSLRRAGDADPGGTGRAAVTGEPPGWTLLSAHRPTDSAIAPAEGAEALVRLLSHSGMGAQVIVSTVPIAEVVQRVRQVTTGAVETSLGDATGPVVTAGVVTPPRTPLETAIANVWSEVLRVEPVGADSDFFELGGNSLVAVQLITQLRRATGVRLPMRALFEASTVGELAVRVEQLRAEAGESADEQPATAKDAPIPRQARRRDG